MKRLALFGIAAVLAGALAVPSASAGPGDGGCVAVPMNVGEDAECAFTSNTMNGYVAATPMEWEIYWLDGDNVKHVLASSGTFPAAPSAGPLDVAPNTPVHVRIAKECDPYGYGCGVIGAVVAGGFAAP